MSFGIDCTASPPIAALKAAGVTFVCRYTGYFSGYNLNDIPAPQGKVLTPGEAKTLGQAGIAVVSNYEWYANRAASGYDSGVWDAQTAQKIHTVCGGPADRPIYFSVDFDTTATPAIIAYSKGVASVLGLARTGAYGGYRVIKGLLDAGAITWAWQTYAWSAGLWDARTHIQQYSNGMILAGMSVDYDRAMKPDFGQWLYGGKTPVQEYTPQSADFGTWFTATDASHWKCKSTGKTVQFGIKGFYSQLSMDGQSLPIPGLPLSDEIYLNINGKQVVLQVFERAGIGYDPNHAKDRQPGTGDCFLFHLNDSDLLAHIPGLPTQPPAPVDTTALITAINAIPDAIAPAVAQALVEAKKL